MTTRKVRCPHKDCVRDCPECWAIINPQPDNEWLEDIWIKLDEHFDTALLSDDEIDEIDNTILSHISTHYITKEECERREREARVDELKQVNRNWFLEYNKSFVNYFNNRISQLTNKETR